MWIIILHSVSKRVSINREIKSELQNLKDCIDKLVGNIANLIDFYIVTINIRNIATVFNYQKSILIFNIGTKVIICI